MSCNSKYTKLYALSTGVLAHIFAVESIGFGVCEMECQAVTI